MAGMTSTNKLVVATRADLVSQFVGDTANKTMEVAISFRWYIVGGRMLSVSERKK